MFVDEIKLSLYYALLEEYNNSQLSLITSMKHKSFSELQCEADRNRDGIIVYGAGVMYDYYISTYENIPIKYVVDKRALDAEKGQGLYEVCPISRLDDEKKCTPILITPVRYAAEIYEYLEKKGFESIFVLAEMEYNREEVRIGVKYLYEHPEIQEQYLRICRRNWIKEQAYKKKIATLEAQMQSFKQQVVSLKQTDSYQYKYILHCNRMISVLIDNLSEGSLRAELIKDQIRFRFCTEFGNGYLPDFENPQSFNEKNLVMQIKEADNLLFATVTDKYEMKKYVADRIGEQYVVPALGVWNDPRDIDWDNLPNDIIIKATNGGDSESVLSVKENDEETRKSVIEASRKWVMKSNSVYYAGFNGTFKHVKQRIIAEKNIEKNPGDLLNYKFWMFHGKAKLYYISQTDLSKESNKTRITYFRMDGVPFEARTNKYPPLKDYRKTKRFDEMISIAEKLSAPFEFVRVDFMETPETLVVGELTLTPDGGLRKFDTEDIDQEIGGYW